MQDPANERPSLHADSANQRPSLRADSANQRPVPVEE
jgi:hypothetical protein